MAEHLKGGGEVVVIWLLNVLNSIVVIPDVLKRGVVVPVYKGSGKDSLRVDSYCSVTLSSMVAKILEFLCLQRLEVVFLEASCEPDSLQEISFLRQCHFHPPRKL